MDTYDRKQKILEILNRQGRVKVSELSQFFGVSEVTIRSDLADMEVGNLLSRVHGGAISSYKNYYNMSLQQRLSSNLEVKETIASCAASMIEENDTVMFNAGTTTLAVFRAIPPRMNLSIVTNSLEIAMEASGNPDFNVVLLGGAINAKYRFVYGDDANLQLERYHADKLFLSVDGINMDSGLTTYYTQEADTARQMLKNSALKIVVADATKVGRSAFVRIDGVESADYIITNDASGMEDELAKLKKIKGPKILLSDGKKYDGE